MLPSSPAPIAILGPTASGKSSLAVELALRLNGTVINGDPFQAIQGLPIGTGQPNEAERKGVPHLGYGLLPLSHRPDPLHFGHWVRSWLDSVSQPILVTGSGLYLRGIWQQLDDLPEVPAFLVDRVRSWMDRVGCPTLHRYLQSVDPPRAAQLHPKDTSRVGRALALHVATGRRPSEMMTGVGHTPPPGWKVLLVQPGRDAQRERITRRVRQMIQEGWIQEVEHLVQSGEEMNLRSLRPLGYLDWLEGGDPLAIEARIVRKTQAYAKRQATWFHHQWGLLPTWDPDRESLETAFLRIK